MLMLELAFGFGLGFGGTNLELGAWSWTLWMHGGDAAKRRMELVLVLRLQARPCSSEHPPCLAAKRRGLHAYLA